MVVIDASALAGWLLPDEDAPDLGAVLGGAGGCGAPWLLWAELRNILLVAERRGRIEPGETDALLGHVDRLGITLDAEAAGPAVMALARRHRLSAYDALYLELALRRGGRLATLDGALSRAAAGEGVEVL